MEPSAGIIQFHADAQNWLQDIDNAFYCDWNERRGVAGLVNRFLKDNEKLLFDYPLEVNDAIERLRDGFVRLGMEQPKIISAFKKAFPTSNPPIIEKREVISPPIVLERVIIEDPSTTINRLAKSSLYEAISYANTINTKSIIHLELDKPSCLNRYSLSNLLYKFTHIKSFIIDSDDISDHEVHTISEILGDLTVLAIYNGRQISDDSILSITALKNLFLLDLSSCSFITDRSVKEIAKLNLEHLVLHSCHLITDESVLEIAKMDNLIHLDLSFCDKITDRSIMELAKLPNLKVLKLSGCKNVTDASLRQFVRSESLNMIFFSPSTGFSSHFVDQFKKMSRVQLIDTLYALALKYCGVGF